jgi:hypothetical protein
VKRVWVLRARRRILTIGGFSNSTSGAVYIRR